MYFSRRFLLTATLAGLAALPALCGAADPVPNTKGPARADRGKYIIEMPLKKVVAASSPAPAVEFNSVWSYLWPAASSDNGPRLDVGKGRVEMPLKDVVRAATPVVDPRDAGKARVEMPLKNVVAKATTPAGDKFVNPKVEAGKVKWHKDLETAAAASRLSGKPVLVFHLMGKLDDQFC